MKCRRNNPRTCRNRRQTYPPTSRPRMPDHMGSSARMRTALLVILTTLLTPASCLDATARADDVLVYPGMEIVQGNTTCTLGYVDPKTRVGMAAGQCSVNSDGPVYDTNGNRVGEMVIAHSNWTDGSTVTGNVYMVDY